MPDYQSLGLDSNMFNLSSPLSSENLDLKGYIDNQISNLTRPGGIGFNATRVTNQIQKILTSDFSTPVGAGSWGTMTDFNSKVISHGECGVFFALNVTGVIGTPVETDPGFRIEVVNKFGTNIYPNSGTQKGLFVVRCFPVGSWYGGSVIQRFTSNFGWVTTLADGLNNIYIAAQRSTTDGTVTIRGTSGDDLPKSTFVLQTSGVVTAIA